MRLNGEWITHWHRLLMKRLNDAAKRRVAAIAAVAYTFSRDGVSDDDINESVNAYILLPM